MSSLFDRTLQSIKANKKKRLKGDIIAIPWSGLPRLSKVLPGVVKENYCIVTANSKVGKCFAKGTKVLMYDNTVKSVEKIIEGDELLGPDSNKRIVHGITKGVDTLYKITQRRGINYTVNSDHILHLVNIKTKNLINISVKDYLLLPKNEQKLLRAVYSGVIKFSNETIVPIDPYFVGLWLGDGSQADICITNIDTKIVNYLYKFANKNNLSIHNPSRKNKIGIRYFIKSPSIIRVKKFDRVWKFNTCKDASNFIGAKRPEYVSRTAKKNEYYNGFYLEYERIQGDFRKNFYSIFNKYNKEIPYVYKYSSVDSRRKLLAGLIDSDGYKRHNCSYEFCLKDPLLSEGLIFIANSLGIRTRMVIKYINERPYHRITLHGEELSNIPIKLDRKKSTNKINTNNYNTFKVEKLNKGEYYGFTVDKDHLFMLKDFTIVHNSQITDFLYVFEPINYLYEHRDSNIDIDIQYYTLEMSSDAKMRQAMAYRLYTKYGKVISPQKLRSIFDNYILEDEVEKLLEAEREWFEFFESKVTYHDTIRNPFGIYNNVRNKMESEGHYTYKEIPWVENGEPTIRKVRDKFVSNNPDKIVEVIVDHYRLLQPEKGDRSVYEAILRFSSQYALEMRDLWKCQVVGVQQQAPTSESQQYNLMGGKTILDKVKPTPDGLGDAKATQQDCNLMLSLFHPARYNQKEYHGIDLTEMDDSYRELYINLNRDGINNASLDLYFNGAVNYFEEIDEKDLLSVYYKLKSIKNI